MDDSILLYIPVALPFIVQGILLCAVWSSLCFVRRVGLLFSLGFPLVCLVKALTDLPSLTSSAAPDV